MAVAFICVLVLTRMCSAVNVSVVVEPSHSVSEGTKTTFICQYERSNKLTTSCPFYTWMDVSNGKSELIAIWQNGDSTVEPLYEDRFSVSNVSLLLISATRNDTGTYECKVRLVNDRPSVAFARIDLTVTCKPKISLQSPVVRGIIVHIVCTCSMDTRQDDQYFLFTGDRLIHTEIGQNLTYVIRNTSKDNAATYYCTIFNQEDSDVSEVKELAVYYVEKPVIVIPSLVSEGSQLVISCSVDAVPVPINVLYRNDQVVQQIQENTLTYTIENVSDLNTGKYFCSASNVAGSSVSEMKNLNVKYVRIALFVAVDGVATCFAEGYPCPTVTISVNGSSVVTGDTLTSTLIEPGACDPVGRVVCNASNGESFTKPRVLNTCTDRHNYTPPQQQQQQNVLVHQLTSGAVGFIVGCLILMFIFCIVKKSSNAKQTVNDNSTNVTCQPNQAVYQSLIKDDGKVKVQEEITQNEEEGAYLEPNTSSQGLYTYCSDSRNIELKVMKEETYEYTLAIKPI